MAKKITKWEPDDFELEMTTHWSFPKRGDWATHDAKWRGNWSPYIPRNIILRYSQEGDLVLDQFAGGGTTLVEAKLLNRNIIGVDVKELFCPETEIKVIGIRHGEKMYETLLTNEECAHATDMGNFYRVPCDKRSLNYDKYFNDGDKDRNPLTEFNSNNTELLNVEQVKEKLLSLAYIREELEKMEK